MILNLIDLCVKRPVSVIMIIAALLMGGVFSFTRLPLQRLPEFSFPRVTIEARYPGLGAEDIRGSLTIPLEDALSSVKGLERIRSVSRDGSCLIVLDFRWGTDGGASCVLAREAVDAVYPSLPEGAFKPVVLSTNPGEEAHAILLVRSPLSLSLARNIADLELRPLLRRIDGVASILLSGGEQEELAVKVDIPRSLSRSLSPASIAQIIASETANIPAGNAKHGDKELVVVSRGKPASFGELEHMLFPGGGGSFTIGDLGSLKRTAAKKESIVLGAGGEYAALEVYKRPGADPVKLSRAIRKTVDSFLQSTGADTEISIVYDESLYIVPGIQKLFVCMLLGTGAVMFVLYFSLRNIRYSVLAGLSLPLSMASSIMVLALSGKSLNNMSLSGIALGIGLVSDTSVIILDSLHELFLQCRAKRKKLCASLIGERAASVAASNFGGTLTTSIVFIPIIFLPGPLGALFGDLSLALLASIISGWLYAQFALPSLFGFLYQTKTSQKDSSIKDESIDESFKIEFNYTKLSALQAFYGKTLKTFMDKPSRVIKAALCLCTVGFALLLSRPVSFVAADAASEIEVVLNFAPGTLMDLMRDRASLYGEQIAALPFVTRVFGRAGSEKDDTSRRSDPDYRKETFIFRCMLDGKVKPAAALAQLDMLLKNLSIENHSIKNHSIESFARFPQDKTEKILGLSLANTVAVKGNDLNEVNDRADEAQAVIYKSELCVSTSRHPAQERPEIRFIPDRQAISYAGLSVAEAARALYAAAEGLNAGELELEGKQLPLKVSAQEMPPLESFPITLTNTGPVFAGSIARFEHRQSPSALARLDRSDTIYIEAAPLAGRGKALSAFLASLCNKKNDLGIIRTDESAFARYRVSLIITVVMVLILLYLCIGAGFESFSLPFLLLLAIPFSLAGAGPALFIAGAGLDSSSALALMVLFGLSVNSGMVLYEHAKNKLGKNSPLSGVVYDAALSRFRPVITTALTTICALLPLAIPKSGAFDAKEQSMALAMLGGVIAGTALTLFAFPLALERFLQRKQRKAGLN